MKSFPAPRAKENTKQEHIQQTIGAKLPHMSQAENEYFTLREDKRREEKKIKKTWREWKKEMETREQRKKYKKRN